MAYVRRRITGPSRSPRQGQVVGRVRQPGWTTGPAGVHGGLTTTAQDVADDMALADPCQQSTGWLYRAAATLDQQQAQTADKTRAARYRHQLGKVRAEIDRRKAGGGP